ncbi:MAG TPA: winged helix DNA-binding domain-containing protein [Actinomycetota bacterium]|nr:winged helix DNA-binding domain-containing protein [Actinomycetota bacterium]
MTGPPTLPAPGGPAPRSEAEVRRARMRAQLLTGRRPRAVAEVVRALGGLQAQDTPASRLAVRPRSTGLDEAAVRRACNQDRSVVRTWAMRGTLHMVAAEDAGWLVALLGPGFAAAGRRRRLQLGLDDALCGRALEALPGVLAGGPLSRADLVRGLAAKGVRIDPGGQAPAHLVGYAALRGLLCRGPDLDGDQASYVLLEDWVDAGRSGLPVNRPRDPEDALAELARRYLGGHGPAAPEDLAAWSGLPVGRARRAFQLVAGELAAVELDGRRLWAPAGAPGTRGRAGPVVRLLGRFDDYLLGWRGRDLILDPGYTRRIQAGGGWIHPAVVVDGRVAGTWRARRAGDRLDVMVEPFGRLPPGCRPALEAEVADLGRFLEVDARL